VDRFSEDGEEEMAEEFWRWTESRWTSPEVDWKDAKIITAGVDVGWQPR
jgi:hypothetical protein